MGSVTGIFAFQTGLCVLPSSSVGPGTDAREWPHLSFHICEMGVAVVPTSWDYLGAFLLSAWQEVGAQLTEASGPLLLTSYKQPCPGSGPGPPQSLGYGRGEEG